MRRIAGPFILDSAYIVPMAARQPSLHDTSIENAGVFDICRGGAAGSPPRSSDRFPEWPGLESGIRTPALKRMVLMRVAWSAGRGVGPRTKENARNRAVIARGNRL